MPLSDHPQYPITVATCEDRNQGSRLHALVPGGEEPPSLFCVQDPFGLRKAIVPIFQADSADILTGMGTGFALDPWGNFLSADHVTDFLRQGVPEQSGEFAIQHGISALALLGMGLIYGQVGVPREALVPMTGVRTPMIEVDDPLNFMGPATTRPYDITFLKTPTAPPEQMIRNLPMRRHPSTPRVGELVVAVGFPQIQLAHGTAPKLPTSITEGMFAAYGIVAQLHPEGRDRSARTPVFEVQANWPSGMSGGPVFNAAGEVIGLVSRSIAPADGEALGTAWAAWLAASIPPEFPVATTWPESIDCQTALNIDPLSASNFDPPYDADQRLACPALAGVAEGRPSAGDGRLRL